MIPVDLDLGLGNASTSGCEAADFVGPDWSGPADIALSARRGACAFGDKAVNATNAGAEGVIIFNQGNTANAVAQDIIGGTLGDPIVGDRGPSRCVDTSYTDGSAILDATTVDLSADTEIVTSRRRT